MLSSWSRLAWCVFAAGLLGTAARAATWFPLGPFGGSARSLAADPADSRHLFLGTATGWIYDSHDGGTQWKRVAQIARRNDLVIDHIVVDTQNPKRLVVGAFTVDHTDGGVFISDDYGKNWYSQAEMRGQSVRSLARSASNDKELVAGTLRGIFRSDDNGVHWKQISPEGSAEIKEVQSIAIDPADPNVIYAGTWHLPWKTTDGGATWSNIKDGIIDDSDVFSIIVDPKDPQTVYASACSGIYKSTNAGEHFTKVQGIPSAARRTRKLDQDPTHLEIVFAGTTEGLYKTADAGAKWDRLTPGDVIVNDVYVDPGNANHVLIATDRGGVYRSEDGGASFESSNDGFSARQVTAYTADEQNPGTVYVGVVNDKATGGVFQSTDGGVKWRQQSDGLAGHDVFSLVSLEDGTLLAGTGHGIFRLQSGSWADSSALEPGAAAPAAEKSAKTAIVLPAPTRLSTPVVRNTVRLVSTGRGSVSREAASRRAVGHAAAGRRSGTRSGTGPGTRPGVERTQRRVLPKHPPAKRSVAANSATRKGAKLVQVNGRLASAPAAQHAPPKHPVPVPAAPATPKPALTMDRVDAVVYSLVRSGNLLYAGSSTGLLRSADAGQHWAQDASLAMPDVHFVSVLNPTQTGAQGASSMVLAGNLTRLSLSPDGGRQWDTVPLPGDLTQIGAAAIDSDKNLWVGGREGVWLSTDYGATWKTLHNLFLTEVDSIYFDPIARRVLVTASNSPVAFSVSVPDHKVSYFDTGWNLRFVRPVGDHLIGATLFDGVVVQPRMVDSPVEVGSTATVGK